MRLSKRTFEGDLCRSQINTPVGVLVLISSRVGIRAILCERDLKDEWCRYSVQRIPVEHDIHLEMADAELHEYFSGRRKEFGLQLDPVGTEFQMNVWTCLRAIPFGIVYSYSDQAQKLGSFNLARAVGGANRSNPISIVVPCHRVAGKDGSLTGFAGGLEMKKYLLELEGIPIA